MPFFDPEEMLYHAQVKKSPMFFRFRVALDPAHGTEQPDVGWLWMIQLHTKLCTKPVQDCTLCRKIYPDKRPHRSEA